jgi:hypothetical protein
MVSCYKRQRYTLIVDAGLFQVNTTLIANKKLTTSHSFPERPVFDKRPFSLPNAIFAGWRSIAEKSFYSSN